MERRHGVTERGDPLRGARPRRILDDAAGGVKRSGSGGGRRQTATTVSSKAILENAKGPQFVWGSVSGAVGVVASLPKTIYVRLWQLMRAMQDAAFHNKSRPVDDHEKWRSYQDFGGAVLSKYVDVHA